MERTLVQIALAILFIAWTFGDSYRNYRRAKGKLILPPRLMGYVFSLGIAGLGIWLISESVFPVIDGGYVSIGMFIVVAGLAFFPTPITVDEQGVSGRLAFLKRNFRWEDIARLERAGRGFSPGLYIRGKDGKCLWAMDSHFDTYALEALIRRHSDSEIVQH